MSDTNFVELLQLGYIILMRVIVACVIKLKIGYIHD